MPFDDGQEGLVLDTAVLDTVFEVVLDATLDDVTVVTVVVF